MTVDETEVTLNVTLRAEQRGTDPWVLGDIEVFWLPRRPLKDLKAWNHSAVLLPSPEQCVRNLLAGEPWMLLNLRDPGDRGGPSSVGSRRDHDPSAGLTAKLSSGSTPLGTVSERSVTRSRPIRQTAAVRTHRSGLNREPHIDVLPEQHGPREQNEERNKMNTTRQRDGHTTRSWPSTVISSGTAERCLPGRRNVFSVQHGLGTWGAIPLDTLPTSEACQSCASSV